MKTTTAGQPEATICVAHNPETRKYERINPEDELVVGQRVIRLFWHDDRYITVPGNSLYEVADSAGTLQLIDC